MRLLSKQAFVGCLLASIQVASLPAWDAGPLTCVDRFCSGGVVFPASDPNQRWRGNTHRWVVAYAAELLKASPDPNARAVGAKMNERECQSSWEQGLWAADGRDLDEKARPGSHFYNDALLDYTGEATTVRTYNNAGEQTSWQDAQFWARDNLAKFRSGPSDAARCYSLGLALHYITDLTQPMHSSTFSALQAPTFLHPTYEAYVPTLHDAAFDKLNQTSWDRRFQYTSAENMAAVISNRSNRLYAKRLYDALRANPASCAYTPGETIVDFSENIGYAYTYRGSCFRDQQNVNDLTVEILVDAVQSTAAFLYAALGPGEAGEIITLTTYFGGGEGWFLSAVNGGGLGSGIAMVTTVPESRGPDIWEFFKLIPTGKDRFALKTAITGNYLSAVDGGGVDNQTAGRRAAIVTSAWALGPWETFTVLPVPGYPGYYTIQTVDGHYLTAEDGGNVGDLRAFSTTRSGAWVWEFFKIHFYSSPGGH